MTAFDFSLEPSGFAMNHNGEKKIMFGIIAGSPPNRQQLDIP